ncbi:Glycosyl hydrolases family 18 [Planctomycetes bacterium Poly30]|uniref:Glycosyl hydrolases family 18 n=1 Tax=Saltatorellus ferox TaxID=2528018 RepID=A0A518F193_9BACT|nr:Glycosyl hydrolases family 18 [Planctomycetes bacterium Poly30]
MSNQGSLLPIAVCCLLTGALAPFAMAQEGAEVPPASRTLSTHGAHILELGRSAHAPSEDHNEAERIGAAIARQRRSHPTATDVTPNAAGSPTTPGPTDRAPIHGIDDDFIVFGYLQSETQVFHQRWHALTHVGSRFVGFDSAGNLTGTSAFTNRSSYLKAGGAADTAGVKMILVLASFDDGAGGAIASVMTSASRRANLVNQLVNLLANDSYCHGVSIDIEFSWGSAVRDGLTAFMAQLRAGLDGLGPGYELSIYTNAIFSSNQWDFDAETGITPSIDYMLYSMYDWASGSTPHAISDFDNCLGSSKMHAYLNDGLPPEKLVPVISAYSRQWSNTASYDVAGTSPSSSGFTDGLFDVTLNSSIGTPAQNYVTGDEAAWYTWNSGSQRVRTFEGLEGMEYKIRHALSLQDPSGRWSGRRIGGVGFWSLMWMAEFTSIDPRTGGSVARTRTYPHVYEMLHEIFAPPGTRAYSLDSFSGLDPRWRDPNLARDTVGDSNGDSSLALVPAPAGEGNAMRIAYDFEGSGANRAVVAHEVLASPLAPTVTDTNSVLGVVSASTKLKAFVLVTQPQAGYTMRMLAVDGSRQLESSPSISLAQPGWHVLTWDLTDPFSVAGFPTQEPAFFSGNSILNSTGLGARDIGFYGFVIEGTGDAVGEVIVDSITYEHVDPEQKSYRINEFRYAESGLEFVEIHGPAGPLPSGLTLRTYGASNGTVAREFPLSGSIPDMGGGFGLFVAGDPGTPNVASTTGFSAAGDDLSNLNPTGLQLLNVSSQHVYDNVVYEAFGGLGDLIRRETLGVTSGGWPWFGEIANGFDGSGARYTAGRYPDGLDTGRNAEDFSFQAASPGEPNGDRLTLPATFDFETASPAFFSTFGSVLRSSPLAAGIPASPGGGLAWRCVDPSGGGVIGIAGDAALGRTRGYTVTGDLYVPSSTDPAQAIALGICGSQGSRFFPADSDARLSGYENGYWLIYENRAGVNLNDGRIDHGLIWELVHASHDQMDGEPVQLMEALPNFVLGIAEGQWVPFSITLDPYEPTGGQLVVILNDREIFRGALPEGGRRSGAFQVGFRENHAGPPIASEGTWIDNLHIDHAGPESQAGSDPD